MRAYAVAVFGLALVLGAAPPAAAEGPPPVVRPANGDRLTLRELGGQLFAANCAICHGSNGEGVPADAEQRGGPVEQGAGPPLRDAGALAADFYLRTGYMPLGDPGDEPVRSRVRLREREVHALVDYVASLGGGPPVPDVDPDAGSVSEGLELFTGHCAGCHQVVGEGGVVTSVRVPPLDRATPVQIAEAVRIGPYVMPAFSQQDIDDDELNSIVAYLEYAKQPRDAGGWGIGHLGPFPEGMVTWLLAAVALVVVCIVIGKRMRQA
jgi:ubiquinol-cytochrome c reductase cytochrome c subunit